MSHEVKVPRFAPKMYGKEIKPTSALLFNHANTVEVKVRGDDSKNWLVNSVGHGKESKQNIRFNINPMTSKSVRSKQGRILYDSKDYPVDADNIYLAGDKVWKKRLKTESSVTNEE